MNRSEARWLRLAVVAGAIAGSALVSSAVVATDESPPIDESIGVESTPGPPLEDIAVIEFVIVESVVAEPAPPDSDATEAPLADTEGEAEVGEELLVEPDAELRSATVAAAVDHIEGGTDAEGNEPASEVDHGGSEHESGHGGSGGQGTPYLVTFQVDWYPDGTLIADLDRSSFELSAGSQTGSGKPTSATCIYTDGSDVLECEFTNKGHRSESDGLIVPARKTATYTVDVVWSPRGWTIEGADDVGYSCRNDVGSDDHGGSSHEGGSSHDGGGGGERRTVPCVHIVTMRQIVVPPTVPPAVDPVPEVTPPVVPGVTPPVVPDVTPPVVVPVEVPVEVVVEVVVAAAPVAVTSRSALPATGNSISVLLVLAGLLVVTGSTAALFSRRTPSPVEVES